MSLPPLDNLVRIGELKTEPPAQAEFDGLVRSGQVRLADAAHSGLSLESRFDLAYNAAHSLSLAAMRRHGHRSDHRCRVLQCCLHTRGPDVTQWRVLEQAHRKRHLAGYERDLDVDEALSVARGSLRSGDRIRSTTDRPSVSAPSGDSCRTHSIAARLDVLRQSWALGPTVDSVGTGTGSTKRVCLSGHPTLAALQARENPAGARRRSSMPRQGRPSGSRGPGRAFRDQRFIAPKNSSLVLVFFILSSMNSIAASSSIGCSSLRRIQIFCSRSGSISRSSRRVPERLTAMAG